MPRELSLAVEAAKNSASFTYYDFAEIHLPYGQGDLFPRVLYVATSDIVITPVLDFYEFVYKAFIAAFGRAPLSSEFTAWRTDLETELAVSQSALKTAAAGLIDDLFTDSAYTARLRNDDQFVGDLYAAYLGRVADPPGKAFWVGEVGTTSRNAVRAAFGTPSQEFAMRLSRMTEPHSYEPDIRDMGDLTFSEGAAIDSVEFALTNTENTYSDLIGQSDRRLYPAPAIVSRAFRVDDGTYEPVEMMRGFARFSSTDGETARVMITSDFYRRGVDVVETITQHCLNVYKGEGCDSPDTSPTCSRIEDDAVNGCIVKAAALQIIDTSPPNNRPSFKGIAQLTIATAVSTTPGVGIPPSDPGPGGWPGDYDPHDPRIRTHAPYRYGL